MQKKINVTLGGMIMGKSFWGDVNDRKYYITFKRADRREMTVSADRQTYERCVEGNLAVFNIDVIMEKEGDINHYDKKLSQIMETKLVGVEVDAEKYQTLMSENLTWLSRYAKPLPEKEEKKKGNFKFVLIGMVFIIFGLLCVSVTPISLISKISKGEKYENFTHIKGEVTYQKPYDRPGKNSEGFQTYDISIIVTYQVDDKEYTLSDKIYSDSKTISDRQDMIYNNDNPNESYLASYDAIAKTYIPDGNDSVFGFILVVIITLAFGFTGVGIGGYIIFEVIYEKVKK